jgi:hypothetical protein
MFVNPWLQISLSLAAGLLTAGGALLGVRLSVRGSNRAEWWRRFTWVADLAHDDLSGKRMIGLELLAKLAQSSLAQRDDYLLLDAFHERVLNKGVLDEVLRDCPELREDGNDDE